MQDVYLAKGMHDAVGCIAEQDEEAAATLSKNSFGDLACVGATTRLVTPSTRLLPSVKGTPTMSTCPRILCICWRACKHKEAFRNSHCHAHYQVDFVSEKM